MAKSALPEHIDSIYPLSPMQEGMLFHTLMNPGTGIYLMQNRYLLEGDLNYDAFVRAWELVFDRHPVLRTSFVWKSQKRPLQAVHKRVDAPIVSLDWRGQTRREQIARLDTELAAELREGFDFAKAPLMRLWLIRLADDCYQFVHSFHHILLDEWCISLLLMDFLAHYGSLVRGEQLTREKPRPYRDYIAWLQKQDINAAESFWRGYLQNFPTPTPLPYDRLPEGLADQNEDAADHCLHLSADTSATLLNLAQRHRLTVNTFFQGAWALLLNYYSSEREVLFGVTVAGRPTELPGVESILGLFINTLPLRISMQPDRSLMDWLKDLLAENVRVRQYDYAPLVQMQRWSEVPRGEALFHSLFVFENAPVDPELCEGRIIFKAEEEQYRVHTNYPLTVMGWPGRELGLKISYDKRLFDAETTGRMIRHLKTLLEAMAERPTARLAELLPLKQDERNELLTEWNPVFNISGENESDSLPQLFEKQVEHRPDSVAAQCLDEKATYRELNRWANRVAHVLAEAGVGPDTIVALLDDRGLNLLTMMVGVFKTGGAYLPLDPHHPVSRLTQILKLSRSPIVLASRNYLARLQEAIAPIDDTSRPRLMAIEGMLDGAGREDNPGSRGQSDHLAYVIYTSGSTGVPKGAMVTRRGMLNNIRSKVSGLALGPSDIIAQTASQCFDISVWQFLTALTCGARTSIVPDETSRDPFHLLTHLERTDMTILETVPALLQGLLEAASEAGSDAAPRLHNLRWVLPTGEALPPPLCCQWLARYPAIPLLNAYGPAECADDVAVHPIFEPPAADITHMPIGRPIEHTRLHILNAWLEPVPPGVPGELYVIGVGVGRGYLQDPARTAEVFLPDRFGSESGARMYRTGDLARYRRDGAIEFIGRVDQQIKLRGFRIELGEIETHLLSSPLVREAAVLLHTDARGEKRLAAYLVGHEEKDLSVPALRDLLASQLPEYMVPTAFVPLPALPRTPNGKIDRLTLAALDLGDQFARPYTAPRTATEEILSGIWSDVLGVERVGVHDDFFELGGHSLLATQIMSRLRSAFHIELSLRTVFESTSVAALAAAVDRARKEGAAGQAPPLVPVARTGPLPTSFAQQRLWFLAQLEPEGWSYNLPFGIRIKGPVDAPVLQQCFAEVTRRHESLRTTFAIREQDPVQEVAAHLEIDLPIVDLLELPDDKREENVQRLAETHAHIVFDLSRGPLWHARLLHVRTEEHVLLLTLHHVIADGWSMNIFLQEVLSLYASLVSGEPSPLQPLPIQYADYAQWQRKTLQGDVLERQLTYWKEVLAGAPTVLSLPTDHPRPSVERHRGARFEFELPADLLEQLKTMSRRHGVTVFMTLLAAFQVLLFRHTGQSDLCIGTPIAGRTRLETESLIGLFVNTLVLRTDVSKVVRFTDLLDRVRDVVLGAQAHQDLPFEYLVDALQPARDLSRSPLFQVMFALQTLPGEDISVPGVEISSYDVDPGSAKFDLSLEMTLESAGLHGFFEYNSDLFDRETIRRLDTHYRHVLDQVVAQPEAALSGIEVLGAEERRQVVEQWNATRRAYPTAATVPELIYAQAQRTPAAAAVRFDEQVLSYGALWRRSAVLAAELRRQGVGPDVLVGLCAERSLDMVIGLLGILQVGGAYVPIDPSYPAERIAYMLADAAPSVLLTQPALRGTLPPFAGVCLDLSAAMLEEFEPADLSPTPVRLDQLAYTIYTSGSTGRPKGAGNTHGGLLNRLQWMQDYFSLTPADRVLQKTPFSFDVSVWELFWPLMTGAELVLALPDEHKDGVRLKERIVGQRITTLHFVPPMLQAFLETPGVEVCAGTLKRIVCSGEALSAAVQRQCWARLPGVELHNLYGPTEAAIDVTVWSCNPSAPADPIPIGRPIANTQIYLVDQRGEPVPIGVPGELHIGGVNVARGYHRRPALTAERFVPDAFSAEPGGRVYRTGDLARYRPDGAIEYLGRLDHQVKIRGVRIELGEIESCLLHHPAVHEAVVVAQDTASGHKRLAGYVVPRAGHELSEETLRHWVSARLPEAFVPGVVLVLDALPLTPNGKVDRKALPVPDLHARRSQAYEEPVTDFERILATIWAEVLGQPRVGRLDNFFELGGDSILSLQIIARAKQAGLILTPRQLFQYQTPAELAEVATQEAAQTESSLIMLPPEQGPVTGDVPLTPVQHWFFEQNLIEPHHWNQSILLEIKQPLNHQALVNAMQDLVRHHDMLRARFDRTEHGWRQWVEPEANVDVHRADLSAWSTNDFIEQFEELAEQWQTRLHLTDGPLLRIVWFDRGPKATGRLLVVVHHLVMDGVSWRVLLEDLQQVYLQRLHSQTSQLAAKTTSFQQWAVRLTEHAQSEALSTEASYWLHDLSDSVQPLPVDEPDGMRTENSVGAVTVTLEAEQTRALLYDVAGAYHTRIEDLLLTALTRTITEWTGCAETLIDLEWHGREDLFPDLDLSRTVGWFTAIHPMLLRVEGQDTGDDVKSVKEQLRRIPGRGVGYGVLRYLLKSEAETALRRRPGAEVCFNYFGQLDRAVAERSMFDLAQESVGKEHGPDNRMPYELTVNAEVLRDRLSLTWSYSRNRYRRTTIERLGHAYVDHLHTLITHCTSSEAGGYTPSDFPDVEIEQDVLDTILERMDESHAR
ncbi:MAG: amino acid adenylation domain-containing protein [Nitrospira sp.]|nr:amino acid adenylation domain-containing protein [Nitrospira sp.]